MMYSGLLWADTNAAVAGAVSQDAYAITKPPKAKTTLRHLPASTLHPMPTYLPRDNTARATASRTSHVAGLNSRRSPGSGSSGTGSGTGTGRVHDSGSTDGGDGHGGDVVDFGSAVIQAVHKPFSSPSNVLPRIPSAPLLKRRTSTPDLSGFAAAVERTTGVKARPVSVRVQANPCGSPAANLEYARGLPMLKLAHYAKQLSPGAFFYMMPVHGKGHVEHHAYNLKAVDAHEIDRGDFYTISSGGVEHVMNGGAYSELTGIDRWIFEIHQFIRMRALNTFSKFRLRKQWTVWRSNVVRARAGKMASRIEAKSFFLDTLLQPALLSVRALCIDAVELQLLTIDATKTYTLQEFLDAQHSHVDAVTGKQ